MRAPLDFDPRACDYGPATEAVRALLLDWAEIDWFEPPAAREAPAGREAEARRLFLEHNARGRAYAPELFADPIDVQCEAGDWERFVALCASVRGAQGWDWKFSMLKVLSRQHAEAHDWRLEDQGVRGANELPRPGDLFYRLEGADGRSFVMWNGLGLEVEGLRALPAARGDSAGFYYSYARIDLLDCIQWQLAERSADLAGNPFHPLVRCYRAGFYPFCFDRASVTLFRFEERDEERDDGGVEGRDEERVEEIARALPTATLLPPRRRGGRPKA